MSHPNTRFRAAFAAIAAALLALAGCAQQETSAPSAPTPAPAEAPVAGVPSATVTDHGSGETTKERARGEPVVPPGMSAGAAMLTPTPALDARITQLEKAGSGSAADKKELAEAYAKRGQAHLSDDAAAPRVKYPAALRDFRRALALDPTNNTAKESANTIEQIYRSMGRPVPGEGGS
jgi:tetratricopeptide (TPR) repeat protein